MDAYQYTTTKLNRHDEKVISRSGLGDTDQGLALTEKYLETYSNLVVQHKEASRKDRGFRGKQRLILDLDETLIAAVSLNAGFSALGQDNTNLSVVLRYLGNAIRYECYGQAFRLWNTDEAKKLEVRVKRTHSSLKHRRTAIRALARKAKFTFEDWTDLDVLQAGKWLLHVLVAGPAFRLNEDEYFTLTDEALANLDDIMSALVIHRLYGVPVTGELPEWSGSTLHIDGLPYSLVRTYQKPVQRHVEKALKAGSMSRVLEALNAAQSVRWRINEPILALIRHCYAQGIPVPGLPPKEDISVPRHPKPWADMTDTERYLWRRSANQVKTINRSYLGQREVMSSDLAMAEHLLGTSFATAMNMDYRGRIYGIPHLNFQREDRVRALFLFDQGQIVEADGLYWLKVHLANCGDFNKLSKKPFDDRVWWVDDNLDRLLAIAKAPLDDLWWTEADAPFLFVASCMALKDAIEGRPVHMPCSWDGSCSGLQHLAMASRCEKTGFLTNLTPAPPQDIYQAVADLVKQKVSKDLSSTEVIEFRNKEGEVVRKTPVADIAKRILDYGVTRSLVKRNVMTYSYSSKRSGMQDQILEDTMRPLSVQVLAGEILAHPFGEDGGYAAARYLSGVTYDSIVEAVDRPAEVMKFLQSIARVMAHEGKPTTWTTPLGLPVMLRTPNTDTKQIELYLHDRGVRWCFKPRSELEVPGICKRKAASAIAPSVVHSLDACHLMMVVLAAKDAGITSVALVHDSFGCLPNEASRFRQIIKETFVDLYEHNNVLEDILRENCDHLDTNGYRLPQVPTTGHLSLETVLNADYAFA